MASQQSSCKTSWLGAGAAVVSVGVVLVYVVKPLVEKLLLQKKLNRWCKTQKDTIVLHGFPPAKSLPNLSPFVLKVETYLRLANLHYIWDRNDYVGPKGKSPWITLNGTHVADSELIIKFLSKKFEKDFSETASKENLATATVVKTMLEEFFVCAIGLERFVYNTHSGFGKLADCPIVFFYFLQHNIKSRLWGQGVSRHSREEIADIMTTNLKAVSVILGKNKYFGGDNLCEEDCGIFGVLAQCLWGLPEGTPYEKLMNGECSNLKDYCLRIKEKLFADWDHILAK